MPGRKVTTETLQDVNNQICLYIYYITIIIILRDLSVA